MLSADQATTDFAEQHMKMQQDKQVQQARRRAQRELIRKRLQAEKDAAAAAEAEAYRERKLEEARVHAMRADIREKQRREKEDDDQANKWCRADMELRLKQAAAFQRERAQAHKQKADEKKEELLDHLRTDHRVPRWYALGWHFKDEGKEWRWPFSLDWTWVERGERVLHDERFVGLNLPPFFVRPSERIQREREKERQQVRV